MTALPNESEPLLTPAEVAAMFRVDPKTVTRWAKAGKISSVRTLGGHRRYLASEVQALLAGVPEQRPSQAPVSAVSLATPAPTALPRTNGGAPSLG